MKAAVDGGIYALSVRGIRTIHTFLVDGGVDVILASARADFIGAVRGCIDDRAVNAGRSAECES